MEEWDKIQFSYHDQAIKHLSHMKKTYLTPENRVKDLELEWNFLQSGGLNTDIGSLDDPEDDNPWGSN